MTYLQAALTVLKKVVPQLIKYGGPYLTTWLKKSKNREALMAAARKATSGRPKDRLRVRIEATLAVLRSRQESSTDADTIKFTEGGIERAQKMLTKLDLPLGSREERQANLRSVRASLTRLHADMQAHLDDPPEDDLGTLDRQP